MIPAKTVLQVISIKELNREGGLILHFDSGHRAEVSAEVKARAV